MKVEVKDVLNDIKHLSYNIESFYYWNDFGNAWVEGMPKIDKWTAGRVTLYISRSCYVDQTASILERYNIKDVKKDTNNVKFSCTADSDIIGIISQALYMRSLRLKETHLNDLSEQIMVLSEFANSSLQHGIFSCGVKDTRRSIDTLTNMVLEQKKAHTK